MDRLIKVWQIGQINYSKALKLQKYLVNQHHQQNRDASNILLCLEHPPVYTTGIRTKIYTEEEEARLKSVGADFYRTDRGGLITFHGPGQLVVYPILNLKHFKYGMKQYICNLERTIIELCKKYKLIAQTSPHTGVWINDNKLCAIGVHGSRFITSHGLALNCYTDLRWFKHIVPCGIEGKGVTSMSEELDRFVAIEEVLPVFLNKFSEIFNCCYVNFTKEESDRILTNL